MRHIIIAAGTGERWANYTGRPKHLIDPAGDGESLVTRLGRQLHKRSQWDVVLTGPQSYRAHVTPHVEVVTPPLGDNELWLGATKFVNTIGHWSGTGRTVIWYGDCWIEDAAVHRIATEQDREFLHWCRMDGSPVTGCGYGENFAISFWPEHHADYLHAIGRAVQAHRDGFVDRSGGWEIARAFAGADGPAIAHHVAYGFYRDIGSLGAGFTEDFDTPTDYERWRTNWKARA